MTVVCSGNEKKSTTLQTPLITVDVSVYYISGGRTGGGLEQDLGGWKDHHVEKDLEDSQTGSGQDVSDCVSPALETYRKSTVQKSKNRLVTC